MAVKKKAAPRVATKKAVAKPKAAPRKATAAPAPAKKITAIREAYTKTQLLNSIAENTGVARKDVAAVIDQLADTIEGHIKKRAVGSFTLPGLMKITTKRIPAKKARKGVPNPFRPGELMDVAAKPARIDVKVRPLKRLKDMASS